MVSARLTYAIFLVFAHNSSQNLLKCGDVSTFLVGTESENRTRYDDTSLTNFLDKVFQNLNDPYLVIIAWSPDLPLECSFLMPIAKDRIGF